MAGEIYKNPKKDFEALRYKVFEGNNLINQPEFRAYKEHLTDVEDGEDVVLSRKDMDKLLRYVMVLYDKKSPITKGVPNLDLRKREASQVAGYDLVKDADTLKKLYDFTDVTIQIVAIEFLKEQQDMYWSMIVSGEQTFSEYQRALMESVSAFNGDKDKLAATQLKSKLMDDCDRIAERIEGYYTKVFGDGDVKNIAKQTKKFTPESQANR